MLLRCGTMWMKNLHVVTSPFFDREAQVFIVARATILS
jgi:hypothetical protein